MPGSRLGTSFGRVGGGGYVGSVSQKVHSDVPLGAQRLRSRHRAASGTHGRHSHYALPGAPPGVGIGAGVCDIFHVKPGYGYVPASAWVITWKKPRACRCGSGKRSGSLITGPAAMPACCNCAMISHAWCSCVQAAICASSSSWCRYRLAPSAKRCSQAQAGFPRA